MRRLFIALGLLTLSLMGSNAATLSGSFIPREAGNDADLTAVGIIDWVHWGYDSTNATRKWDGSVIGEVEVIGSNASWQTTNNVSFSWSDGAPSYSGVNVFTTTAVGGETNGFAVLIQGDSAPRKIRIYAGVYAARGQLEVTIDDGVTPSYVDSSLESDGETNGFYFLDVQSDQPANNILVRFTAAALYDPAGYVSLQAVALITNASPSALLSSPTNEQNLITGVPTLVAGSAFDLDGVVTNVEFFVNETTKIGEASSPPYDIWWTPTARGTHTMTAVATDNNGAQGVSLPVSFYVTGTNGAVLSTVNVAPSHVNLTEEGTSDWVHWGVYTENSVDRKAGVAQQIGELVTKGQTYNFWDNATSFTWTDGTPNTAVTATPTGVYIVGLKEGFELTVPADPNPRTLKLYVGTYGARGRFTATLSDYSAPVFIDRSVENAGNGPASVYTLNYAAATQGQTLKVTFTCDQMFDGYGNVTMQAATLVSSANPLYLSLAAPTNNVVYASPANVTLQASVTGGSGASRTVEFFNGEVKIGQDSTPPYTFDWTGVPPGIYTVTARTTNTLKSSFVSDPVRIFVTSAGGFMEATFSPSSGSVDLTQEGTDDWVHWGLERKNSVNRKLNVSPQISDFEEIGRGQLDQFADNNVSFSWSDGSPTLGVGGSPTGVFLYGSGAGFEITAPADRKLRRLKVYVGVFAARGEFEVFLSDLSAPPFVHSALQGVYNSATAVYTIDYSAASPGALLTVRYKSIMLFDENWGNVTLQAATLRNLAPVMDSMQITPGATGFNVSTVLGWNYLVDYTDSLFPPNWLPLTSFGGSGATVPVVDFAPSPTNRFYRVRMAK